MIAEKVGIEQELTLTYYVMQTQPEIFNAFVEWLKQNARSVTSQHHPTLCMITYRWTESPSNRATDTVLKNLAISA